MNAISLMYRPNKHYTKEEKKTLRNWYRMIHNTGYGHSDSLKIKARIRESIDKNQVNGTVFVMIDSTDCDHCRSTSLTEIKAGVMSFQALENHVYENAEGSTYLSILSPAEAKEFNPSFRDYIAEAYEDGHPWSVAH
jgi:hypothetical protein